MCELNRFCLSHDDEFREKCHLVVDRLRVSAVKAPGTRSKEALTHCF